MILNLEPVFHNENSRHAFDYAFSLEENDLPGTHACSPVSVAGEVVNKTGLVSLEAKAGFTFQTFCARCAKSVTRKMTLPIKHFLVAKLNDEDNDLYVVVEDMRLELDELVRENILLHFPSRILCSPECKGLCTVCGADLNEGPCDCKKSIDPRLSALAGLLDELDE
ncbi:MAG: DUF177 domain-containing protein [Oscillospiraceae bacterium]|nr:DUF177 domain-containing protein [Oscillospiraceae bacterium]